MSTAERIAAIKRENDEVRRILDEIILHPTDHEGHRLLERQLANNKSLADLIEKLETTFADQWK